MNRIDTAGGDVRGELAGTQHIMEWQRKSDKDWKTTMTNHDTLATDLMVQ